MDTTGGRSPELRLLGPFELVADGRAVDLGGPKQTLLLAMLAIGRNRPVAWDCLVDQLWDGRPPASVRAGLQNMVSRTRRILAACAPGAAEIVAHGAGYALSTTMPADADTFEELVRRAQELLPADAAGAVAAYRAALALWRGPALDGLADRPVFREEAARLDRRRLEVSEALADALLAAGRAPEAIGLLEPVLAASPFREDAAGRLMTALYRTGRQADALRVYADTRRALRDELGIDPGPELRRLEAQVLAQDAALDARRAAATEIRDGPAHNLPARVDRFLGREAELAELEDLLREHRLVTLWGPGGAGKTRLSLELGARALPGFEDGVWFVELAPIERDELVASAAMAALGMLGAGSADPTADLCRYLTNRQVLLVLDNCEHLLAGVAALAGAVLARCPGVRVVTSSRELLNAPGERAWPVPSLEDRDAVALFCERARASHPAFALTAANAGGVAEICRRLDGVPLAIELAAARVRVLGVAGLAARLDDRFGVLTAGARTADPRHQTLRAAVDWSYGLMPPAEQDLLNRLSVLPGTFDLAAAEAVAGEGRRVAGFEVLDLLCRLVDKSLVVAVDEEGDTVRYRTLETIRQYAAEQLEAAGETAATRRRLLAFMLTMPFVAWQNRWQWDFSWKRDVHRDHDNLSAALEFAIADGDAAAALALTAGMWNFWEWSDTVGARRWLERAARMPDPPRTTALVETLLGVTYFTGELRHAREAIALAEELGPGPFLTMMRFFAGHAGDEWGDPALSAHLERGLAEAEAGGFGFAAAWCRHALAWRALFAGDVDVALEHLERAVAAAPPGGPGPFIGAHFLGTLALARVIRGDAAEGVALAEEVLATTRASLPMASLLAMSLARAVAAATLAGRWDRAQELAADLLGLLRRLGTDRWVGDALEFAALALEGIGRPEGAREVLSAAAAYRRSHREATGSGIRAVEAALEAAGKRLGVRPDLMSAHTPTEEAILLALRALDA